MCVPTLEASFDVGSKKTDRPANAFQCQYWTLDTCHWPCVQRLHDASHHTSVQCWKHSTYRVAAPKRKKTLPFYKSSYFNKKQEVSSKTLFGNTLFFKITTTWHDTFVPFLPPLHPSFGKLAGIDRIEVRISRCKNYFIGVKFGSLKHIFQAQKESKNAKGEVRAVPGMHYDLNPVVCENTIILLDLCRPTLSWWRMNFFLNYSLFFSDMCEQSF